MVTAPRHRPQSRPVTAAVGDLVTFEDGLGEATALLVAIETAQVVYQSTRRWPEREDTSGALEGHRGDMMGQCLLRGKLKWWPLALLVPVQRGGTVVE